MFVLCCLFLHLHSLPLLIVERPPRGWWLPGGGIEHKDITPLDGAIREAVEEAGSPTLLPLLSASSSTSSSEELPIMTHLLSLQQSPGRIRFIFRGEWIDDNDNADNTKQETCILKCPPGDDESIEARWVTLNMVESLSERKRGDATTHFNLLQSIKDPWLRGNEPKEFFGLLEHASQEDELIPGLPVHRMNLSEEDTQQKHQRQDEEVLGAFFGRYQSEEALDLVHSGSRAALWITLQCRLIVYCPIQQTFAVVEDTKTFPSSVVSDQRVMTFKQLVHNMIAEWRTPSDEDEEENVGLLRVEHIIHANGRDATLIVYPFVLINSEINTGDGSMRWVSANELSDPLERRLADTVIADKRKDKYFSLDILKDKEH